MANGNCIAGHCEGKARQHNMRIQSSESSPESSLEDSAPLLAPLRTFDDAVPLIFFFAATILVRSVQEQHPSGDTLHRRK